MNILSNSLRDFMISESGYVRPLRGLSLGWLVMALVAMTVVFGTVEPAEAGCYGISLGSCGDVCFDCSGGNTVTECTVCHYQTWWGGTGCDIASCGPCLASC